MVMSNGTGQHTVPAGGNGAVSNGNDPTVVHVNFGLKPRHIYAILAGIPAGLAALGAAGYAVLPASKAEVAAIEQGFQDLKTHVTTEIGALKDVNAEIIAAVRELRASLAQPSPRPRLAVPPRSKPAQTKPSGLGLFDF